MTDSEGLTTTPPPPTGCTPFHQLPRLVQVNTVAIGAVLLGLSAVLWPAWRHDPDLSHGMFVPVLFCLLVYEARRSLNPTFLATKKGATWIATAFCALAVGLLGIAGVYAAVLDWSHSLVGFLLTLSGTSLLTALWIGYSDRRIRGFPFNWTAAVAILLWPLAAPLPPGTYARLSLALQGGVTASVMATLHLVGIAAYRQGNVIELARATVGVSEACSGVRSLISCLAAGLFFSGILLTRVRSRIILIVAAPILALVMNFFRSLILTLVSSRGISIEGAWHDATGVGIIVLTGLLLALFAFWLDGKPPAVAPPQPPGPRLQSRPGIQPRLAVTLLICVGLSLFLLENTHPLRAPEEKTLDLSALLPPVPAEWKTIPDPDMTSYSDILRTKVLASRSYFLPQAKGPALQVTFYLAYWAPGQAPVSLVASHTPDACWPGSGWVASPLKDSHQAVRVSGRSLDEAECRLFVNDHYPQYVWFWHLYGHRALTYEDPYSFSRLLGLAFRYGFQHNQDQLFVRVSSNRPWPEIASLPVVQDFFRNLKPLGL